MTEEKQEKGLPWILLAMVPFGVVGSYGVVHMMENEAKEERMAKEIPTIQDVNKDSLPDLVYKESGRIYLQKKDGSFVSYESGMQQEKAKLDSIYQAKQDSLRRVYEGKLEKISGEKIKNKKFNR